MCIYVCVCVFYTDIPFPTLHWFGLAWLVQQTNTSHLIISGIFERLDDVFIEVWEGREGKGRGREGEGREGRGDGGKGRGLVHRFGVMEMYGMI